uniref:Variant surface glycoprotein 1125.1629 n=1 Tax=Trypanosoma brucei TaxID=5691 RepID=A0A1J0R4P6_9TRYP|nr:variant surface glycoprotein 1125.1629 [Trypanosoma brucei]
MKQNSQVLLIFIASVLALKNGNAKHLQNTTKQLKTACDVASHLTELAKQLKNKLTDQAEQLQQRRTKITQLRAALAMSTPEHRRVLEAVLAATAKIQANGEHQLTDSIGSIIDGIHALAEIAAAENIVNEAAKITIPETAHQVKNTFLTAGEGRQIVSSIASGTQLSCDVTTFTTRTAEVDNKKFNSTITISLLFLRKNTGSVDPRVGPRICGNDDASEAVCADTGNIQDATQLGIKNRFHNQISPGLNGTHN